MEKLELENGTMVNAVHHIFGKVSGQLSYLDRTDLETYDPEWLPEGANPNDYVTLLDVHVKGEGIFEGLWVRKDSITQR